MSLVKRFIGVTASLVLIGSLAACSGDDNEDFTPLAATHNGQSYCVYPDDADAELFCSEVRDSNGNSVPRSNWVESDDVPAGFDGNREYGDNDALELFLFMYLLGHVDFYDSPRYYDRYYHNDSSRNSYKSKWGKYKSNYAPAITKAQSNPKFSTYKSTNGKTYTGTEIRKDKKKLDRLSNVRSNNPGSNTGGNTQTNNPQPSSGSSKAPGSTKTTTDKKKTCTTKKGKTTCK